MKKYLFILIFFATLALSALYCAPYYAVNKLQKAAVEGDLATIQEYIDFDKVREHAQGQAPNAGNPDNDIVQSAAIAAILAQSMEPKQGQQALDMTMGFSGDEHFILSIEEPIKAVQSQEKTTDTNVTRQQSPLMTPVIFVFEKKNFYTWHVTEILMNE